MRPTLRPLLHPQGGLSPFKFDLEKSTFTPSMAVRTNTGSMNPFTTGVMVQGKRDGSGTGDILAFSTGTAIKDFFYTNIDEYQGTAVGWVTCEWNGNDGIFRFFWQDGSGIFQLYKFTDNKLYFKIGNVSSVGLDISSWVAGTTYQVTVRWDTKNTIDGTNKICISINDVHTFSFSSTATTYAVQGIKIGSSVAGASSANAIIQGLTIYRRVLWDGAYGFDIGNGDEIAQIYASGAGKDPTEITGSWDIVFMLPTNQTAGALVTG